MDFKIITSFNVSETQKYVLKSFCEKTIDNSYFVSVRVALTDDYMFSLSMFSHSPEIYFGIYSTAEKAIVSGEISDEVLEESLDDIAAKYAHATSRKPPVVNKELAFAWMDYFNKIVSGEIIPITIE